MPKDRVVKLLVFVFLICLVPNSYSKEELNKKIIDSAIEIMITATEACDFKKSTQYYYKDTKFFVYKIGELVSSGHWYDVKTIIKPILEKCDVKVLSNETLSTEVQFSSDFKTATHKSEIKKVTEVKEGRKYKQHYLETTTFGVVELKLVVLESHVDFLKTERIN